jgi:hypothetical protein
MAGSIVVVWIAFVIFLWPVLSANYRGLPLVRRASSVSSPCLPGSGRLVQRCLLSIGSSSESPFRQDAEAVSGEQTGGDGRGARRRHASTGCRGCGCGKFACVADLPLLERMYDDATFPYDGRSYNGPGVLPVTPTDKFYSVTKNVVDPEIDRDLWRLEIGGHVNSPHTYSFDDLQGFEQVDQETTLMCISNRIGAGLFSNAHWRGVRMRDLIEASASRTMRTKSSFMAPTPIRTPSRSRKQWRRKLGRVRDQRRATAP